MTRNRHTSAQASRPSSGWIPVAGTAMAVVLLAGLVGGLTLRLRDDLRTLALQREADALYALVELQLESDFSVPDNEELMGSYSSAFDAVLESSRLKGVMNLSLFDASGRLWRSVPEHAVDAQADAAMLSKARDSGLASARLLPHAALDQVLGLQGASLAGQEAPLLEITVPVLVPGEQAVKFAVAHYWIDGTSLAAEFASMDRGLFIQAGVAFLAASAALVATLLWAFHRLARSERALRERSEDLARANRELIFSAKTAALGAISAHLIHGIRNPVAGLEGFIADGADAANGEGEGPAWKEAAETIGRITSLVRQVSAVLREESKSEAGGETPVTVAELLDILWTGFEAKAAKKSVQVVIHCDGGWTLGSRTASLGRLILQNLLANAIEASPAGGRITLQAQAADGSNLQLLVSDQGGGLDERQQTSLFHPQRSTKPGGGGLGLAISWHLARHMGGRLELAGTSPSGTSFRLILPLAS